jgi:hypothetical protein
MKPSYASIMNASIKLPREWALLLIGKPPSKSFPTTQQCLKELMFSYAKERVW